MFWADKIVNDIEKRLKDKIKSGKKLIIRDEKTASGRVHIGSMRGVSIHGIVSEILKEKGIENDFLYEINDTDPMDDVPIYLDNEKYSKYLAFRLKDIPSPEDGFENYANYYSDEFKKAIKKSGFEPSFYNASDLYESGRMDEAIKIAIEQKDKIRSIYKEVSGSQKPNDWTPVNVICDNCGKISTTKILNFDGESVEYVCTDDVVPWAKGCGFKGKKSPYKGQATLTWKVEWAAKWYVLDVDIEGGGKDHFTKGGAHDVAKKIAKEVFKIKPPYEIPHEFLLVGGKKMSSSKGRGSSAYEISKILPDKIFRLMLLSKKPMQAIDFDPYGDTIPNLFDLHDKIADDYFNKVESDTVRLFELTYKLNPPKKRVFFMRFSTLAYLVQIPHIDPYKEAEKVKGDTLTDYEKGNLKERIDYVKKWLDIYAPDKYIFKLQDSLSKEAKSLTDSQKLALSKIIELLNQKQNWDGAELHESLHKIKTELSISPREFFGAIYKVLLNKDSGPKAGWFLSVLDRNKVISLFKQAITQ